MYGENGQRVDLEEVREAVERADVLIIGFRGFPERLLIDARTHGAAGPLVTIVEPVSGVDERLRWLRRKRPQFGQPERFTFFVWPHTFDYLDECGVVDVLRAHVAAGDGPEQLEAALRGLRRLEWQTRQDAITGDGWQTLWSSRGTSRSR